MLPTLHVIAPFHGFVNESWSHCAFSMKARRFPKMMMKQGYRCVLYANGEIDFPVDEFVPILSDIAVARYSGAWIQAVKSIPYGRQAPLRQGRARRAVADSAEHS